MINITKDCTARIEEITSNGEITIIFNYDMHTRFNLTFLNYTTIDLYIIPANDRHNNNP